ncbi:hypothetical protein HIJ39_20080 [Sulfobacillus sp. DSM 109850]|uniref:Lipoprotein n=2 Tax=Sulfobacillus harzensis TaxID=2729629 RepID=A0A7Y0Q520_9FIRM|nr:hypothetical protein [Sulfobacillus harzensis]
MKRDIAIWAAVMALMMAGCGDVGGEPTPRSRCCGRRWIAGRERKRGLTMNKAYAVTSRDLWTVLQEVIPNLPGRGVAAAWLHVRPENHPDQIWYEWRTADGGYQQYTWNGDENVRLVVEHLESRLGPLNWAWTDKRIVMPGGSESDEPVVINGWILWLGHAPSGETVANVILVDDAVVPTESEE